MTSTSGSVSHAEAAVSLGEARRDETVYVHVAADKTERLITGSWLAEHSAKMAGEFHERGLGYGQRLGLRLRNSPEFAAAALAAWRLGAVPVPVRWDLPEWELERVTEVVDAALFVGPEDLDWLGAVAERESYDGPLQVSPHMQGICSSGSSGTPKIILSSTPAMLSEATGTPFAEVWIRIPRPQTILVLAPMYHVNAFATLHSMLAGDRLVVLEKFDASRALELIERHRVTTFTATPTMLQRMADSPDADTRDLSSIEWILQGAAPMPPSLVHRWASLIGAEKIVMAYGMTEAIGLTALNGTEYMEHEGSVGRGFRGTEVKIIDDDGAEVAVGELGDIYMRAPSIGGSTYLGQAPQMKATDDGFTTVGDMGYVDADGYLYLVDRRSDLIISGGANVFPAEVEKALIDHPKIADIVVIGLSDPEWGKRVHALIEPIDVSDPPTFEEVRQYAKERLAPYKVPKSIEILDAIPRSEATKVNRTRLVEAREAGLPAGDM